MANLLGLSETMLFNNCLKPLACIVLAAVSCTSGAETFSLVESRPISEFWLNSGLYSYHFQKSKGLNNSNFGLGGEYRYSTVSSVTLGVLNNSDRQSSRYVAWYWQPVELRPVRFGAVVGAMDGYPKMRNGGWFLAAIPTASIEHKNFGVNVMFIPSYQDRLYGAISVQLKFRVF